MDNVGVSLLLILLGVIRKNENVIRCRIFWGIILLKQFSLIFIQFKHLKMLVLHEQGILEFHLISLLFVNF